MKNVYFLLLLCFSMTSLQAQVFFTESFETAVGTGGSGGDCGCVATSVDFSDGGNDYFARVTDGDITANTTLDYAGELDFAGNPGEGTNHYWACEDNDDSQIGGTGVTTLCITLTINIAGRQNLGLLVLLGANAISFGYEPTDNLEIFSQIDGGTINSLGDFREDANLQISLDTDDDDIGDGGFVLQSLFQQYTVAIPGTGNTLSLQFCMTSNSSNEEFAIDHIRVREIPLPVELVQFNAKAAEKEVLLDWETASEVNNDYFAVQRSLDGFSFETIGRVAGHGTTSEGKNYVFIDRDAPSAEKVYYRLEQFDYDGASEHSPVEVVEMDRSAQSIRILPNPVRNRTLLQLNGLSDAPTQITIFSTNGQMVKQFRIDENSRNFELDTSDLPLGSYFLRAESQDWTQTQRFLKMN
ncbi:MAG: T9SS type A sorting domain-containing protein [Bacteroidota bacterium]